MIGRNVRKIFWALALLPSLAMAQRGGGTGTPVTGTAYGLVATANAPTGSCSNSRLVYVVASTAQHYCCQGNVWTACGAAAALGLASDPTACTAGQYVTDQSAAGVLTCAQVQASQLGGTVSDAQVPNDITVNRTDWKSFSLDNPSSSEDVGLWYWPVSATITAVRCVMVGGSSYPFTLRYGTDRNGAGSQVINGGTSCTSTTTGTMVTGLSVSVAAGNWFWLETSGTPSGTVNNLLVTVVYTIP